MMPSNLKIAAPVQLEVEVPISISQHGTAAFHKKDLAGKWVELLPT